MPRSQLCFAFAQALHDLRREVRMLDQDELGGGGIDRGESLEYVQSTINAVAASGVASAV